jgi:FixJ family two-component response regulator
MSGEEAFEILRRISPTVPIILSSGFSQTVAAEKFRGRCLAGFLGKPYNAEQLVKAVETVLNAHDRVN